mgnify:CR=1 FL=1
MQLEPRNIRRRTPAPRRLRNSQGVTADRRDGLVTKSDAIEADVAQSPVERRRAIVLRAAEEKLLKGYGWVDPDKGIVRIPVDRALEIVAQKGLPASKK